MSLAPICKTHQTVMHPIIIDDDGELSIHDFWICDECEKAILEGRGLTFHATEVKEGDKSA